MGSTSTFTINRRFRSTFGVSSTVCARVWQLLKRDGNLEGMTPDHLLWGLMLLKVYSFETQHAGMAGADKKTFRKWSHIEVE